MDFSNQITLSEKNEQGGSSSGSCSELGGRSNSGRETLVGFDGEARKLVEQLMGIKKQLQIISIVGMPGLGKTTLARKVYDDPLIVYHFYVRAWTVVTQVPRKRDLLLGLLRSGFDYKDEDNNLSDEKLSEMLKKRLNGQRYLIVMDDIWDIGAWNQIRLCFPDNKSGSRIIFTSRLAEVPQQAQPKSYQHHLRLLTDGESWDLLQQKVFQKERCPPWLVQIGRHIAKKCHGLPLAIVVISGLLAKDLSLNWWFKVAKDISSYAGGDSKQYMDTLAMSYNHLPPHLKPCFLYFGVFPEDHEIPVWKLILLWVAEGFIKKTGETNLEDIAAGYLKEMISRSLVIVSNWGFDGEIKACIVHDLLRDLCLTKAHEQNFLQQVKRYKPYILISPLEALFRKLHWFVPFYQPHHLETTPRRLCIRSPNSFKTISALRTPNVQSIMCSAREINHPLKLGKLYLLREIIPFRAVRILDLSSIKLSTFPLRIGELENLKYIAIRAWTGTIPASISNLRYLETLIALIDFQGLVPAETIINIWKMVNLRHIYTKEFTKITVESNDGHMYVLENLQTIKSLDPFSKKSEEILKSTPNLRKLRFFVPFSSWFFPSWNWPIPSLDGLKCLEKLTYHNVRSHYPREPTSFSSPYIYYRLEPTSFPSPYIFPVTLKKLSLSGTNLRWSEMEKIGMLPNLEVLKLKLDACFGKRWETSVGGFHRLKYLQLKDLQIVKWNACSELFPNLQHLKVENCEKLEEIPSGLGDIYTLELIEMIGSHSAALSACKIQKDQKNKGNDSLKISVRQAKYRAHRGFDW